MNAPSATDALPASDQTYTITELAEEFAVTPRTIRFYEDKDLLRPQRNGLNRVYARRDRARLKLILRGKRLGFSLADIKEMLDLYDLGDGQVEQLRTTHRKIGTRLEALALSLPYSARHSSPLRRAADRLLRPERCHHFHCPPALLRPPRHRSQANEPAHPRNQPLRHFHLFHIDRSRR